MANFLLKTALSILLITQCSAVFGWSFGDVVINELMWMGTSHSVYDEYLELRNMTAVAVDFSSTPWAIYKNGAPMLTISSGVLPPNGYFLVARLDTASSALSIEPDVISTSLVLNNSNAQYTLYAGIDDTYTLLDVADDGTGLPMAGRYGGFSGSVFWSMERNDPPGDGTLPESWHNACLSVNFDSGVIERGTPRAQNFQNTPPEWDGTLSPDVAMDDSNLVFYALNCTDADGIPDSLQVILSWWKVGEPLPVLTSSIYGISSGDTAAVIISPEYTEPARKYAWTITLDDGADTLYSAGTLFVHFNRYDLAIDELCWGGSSKSTADEWLEILNEKDDSIFFEETPFYLWRIAAGGSLVLACTISSGYIPPDGRWLIKRLPDDDPNTAVAVAPDIVLPSLSFPDGAVFVAISDCPDTQFFIDVAGVGAVPPSGVIAPDDSLWATMVRVHPISNGAVSASWRTSSVSLGFIDGVPDRGTPGNADVENEPPVLSFADTIPAFSPDTGTRDTSFAFRIIYSDPDGDPPDSAVLIIDRNGDNIWSVDEVFELFVESGTDYSAGVIMRADVDSLAPTLDGQLFSFRVNDNLTTTAFPVPAVHGPVVFPTAGIELSSDSLHTDTLYQRINRYALTTPIGLRNTGDLPADIRLKIARPDTFVSDCCAIHCQGGWMPTCDTTELFCNKYIISAIFLPDEMTPDSSWFNELGSEDCLRLGDYQLARGDSLGYEGASAAYKLPPNQTIKLWLLLQLPMFSIGVHSEEDHIITLNLNCLVNLP